MAAALERARASLARGEGIPHEEIPRVRAEMSEAGRPERIAVIRPPEARAGPRAIERETALRILRCVDRYRAHRTGDVKKRKPPPDRLP